MKVCNKCRKRKALSEFQRHTHTRDRLRHECRDCSKKYQKASREKAVNRPYQRAQMLKRFYNMTPDDFDRMMVAQSGRCAICHTDKPGGPSHFKFLCVDHDHATGAVRGLLCRRCNSILGYVDDSIELLASSIEYLAFHNKEK